MNRMLINKSGQNALNQLPANRLQCRQLFMKVLSSTGQPLDAATRAFMEPRFGHDFSRVRVHTDGKAAESAESINALAYASGPELVLGAGHYPPVTLAAQGLLAHELAHTIQQGAAGRAKIQRRSKTAGNDTIQPEEKTPQQELEDLRKGNCEDAQAYAIAKRILIASYANKIKLGPADEQLLVGIIQAQSGVKQTIDPQHPAVPEKTFADYARARKTKYLPPDVQAAAWAIVQDDPNVENALLFFGGIKNNPAINPDDWKTELAKFFDGTRTPTLGIGPLGTTADTPDPSTDNRRSDPKHKIPNATSKEMALNERNSFVVAVSSYLHEMCHYMDIWYESQSAKEEGHYRAGAEQGKNVPDYETGAKSTEKLPDPQITALTESLEALIDQMIKDREREKPQANEHPRVGDLRKTYHEWLAEEESKQWDGKNNKEIEIVKEKERERARKKLRVLTIRTYGPTKDEGKRWGLKQKGGSLKASGIELGYAFEKYAYGFFREGQQPGEWANDFYAKFEQKYWRHLK